MAKRTQVHTICMRQIIEIKLESTYAFANDFNSTIDLYSWQIQLWRWKSSGCFRNPSLLIFYCFWSIFDGCPMGQMAQLNIFRALPMIIALIFPLENLPQLCLCRLPKLAILGEISYRWQSRAITLSRPLQRWIFARSVQFFIQSNLEKKRNNFTFETIIGQ